MSALQTVRQLKEFGEDYEYYPTTREIIEAMYWDLLGKKVGEETYRATGRHYSILDIGAGDGKLLKTINEICNEQPLLDERFKGDDREYYRNENERNVNRVFIDKYMAIEKSSILSDKLPKEALVVGTEFYENTLIDKSSDIIFSNPPFSEYTQWAEKIIREGNAKTIYLVIPQRWGKHKGIAQALKDRKAKVKIVGKFSFLNAEDRKARAFVSLVKIDLTYRKIKRDRYYRGDSKPNVDPFDLWFNDTFKISADRANHDTDYERIQKANAERKDKIQNEIVAGNSIIPVLVQLYNKELEHLMSNYRKLSELDYNIFKELNVDVESVLKVFKEKIRGLKNFYWEELFSNLSTITDRLTKSSRDKLRAKLIENASIDFTEGNIRSIVIWVLKNANHYYEVQMLEFYDAFTTDEGIALYKSNQHFVKDNFRYNRDDKNAVKYALDYRIILHYYVSDWDVERGRISDAQIENINDAVTIAKNLNFSVDNTSLGASSFSYGAKTNIYFNSSSILKKKTKTNLGKIEDVYIHTDKPNANGDRIMEKDGIIYVYDEDNDGDTVQYKIDGGYYYSDVVHAETDIFTTAKPYKNGNCHFQFSKEFIKKLNLEIGRLRGWLRDPKHASEEFDITEAEANEFWNSNFSLLPSQLGSLLPSASQ